MIRALQKLLEARDIATEGHEERMESIVLKIGEEMGLDEKRLSKLRLLAQFHDIGKIGIADRILFKPGPLEPEEMEEMRRHTQIGYLISKSIPELKSISEMVLRHHESWDGKGYPLGLSKNEIPLECRIISVIDAFDAMTNNRPYRKAMSVEKAFQELENNTGTQFDPQIVPVFIRILNQTIRNEIELDI